MPRSVNSEAASFPSLAATKGIIQCNFKNIIFYFHFSSETHAFLAYILTEGGSSACFFCMGVCKELLVSFIFC